MEAANAAASGSVSLGGADYMVEPSRRRPGGRQGDDESSDPITSLHVAGFPPSYGNYTEDDLKAAFAALNPPEILSALASAHRTDMPLLFTKTPPTPQD